uniref:5-formyltetrahydrofolate cyclo-ligase n=1 Tax=Cellvibrio fontiphilus TaxID=1815559 RepID=UPI002B4BAF9F|nr:5-formyltetrahydrofolate cyclo-ligase [Cellvibrio fontiphilus]
MADAFDLPPSATSPLKQQLRNQLRTARRALTPAQQQQASLQLLRHLMKLPQFMRAQHIALYIASDGEIDPQVVARQLWKMEKHTYLPVLRPGKSKDLWFVEFTANTQLSPNRYGIPEPDHRHEHRLPANLLDVVLMPLVGFDARGARLGMGGGFYDSTFAFKQKKPEGKPYLIGLAHSCQQTGHIPTDGWDIPLFAIATDSGILKPQY